MIKKMLDFTRDESKLKTWHVWLGTAICLALWLAMALVLSSCSVFQPDRYFVKGCLEICKKSPGVELTIDRDDSDNLYKCSCKRGK